MLQDPILKPLMESPTATCWIGHEGHVMAYPIRNGTLFNFVMCHPGSVPVGKPNENAPLDEMRARYKDWDPVITRLINIVPQCLKWQNAELEKFDQWVSKSGKVVLIGDACHGMVPYMAQGAAMAIEDGITLNECLARAKSTKDVPGLLQHYVNLRRDRCYIILDAARNNGNIWHLPDGPEQEKRDKGMREGPKEEAVQDSKKENPNKWSDPSFQPWMFGYDAYAEVSDFPSSSCPCGVFRVHHLPHNADTFSFKFRQTSILTNIGVLERRTVWKWIRKPVFWVELRKWKWLPCKLPQIRDGFVFSLCPIAYNGTVFSSHQTRRGLLRKWDSIFFTIDQRFCRFTKTTVIANGYGVFSSVKGDIASWHQSTC